MAEGRRRRGRVVGFGWVALGVGAAAATAVAAEKAWVRRDRGRTDPYADEPYGTLGGRSIGPVASFDGTLLNVEEAGSGPTVILSHGFSLNATMWHHQIKELSADHRLVLYDHRGHGGSGLSPSDDWSLDALAKDLDAVIRDAAPDEPVVLVGHSLGGMTLLKYCELFPAEIGTRVAGLMLVDTTAADVMGGMLPSFARRVEAAIQGLQEAAMRAVAGREDHVDRIRHRAPDLAYLATRVMGFGPSPSPAQVNFVHEMLSDTPTEVWLKVTPSILGHDVTEALHAIDVPVLVLVGMHDRLTPTRAAERIADAIPDAESVIIPGAGHMPMLERPREFNDHLRRFVAKVRATARR